MKVILLNPEYWVQDGLIHMPLELTYISSTLKRDSHDVKVIDLSFGDISDEEFQENIKEFSPDIVIGITITKSYANFLEAMKKIKKIDNKILTVAIWEHVTFIHKEVLERHNYIDIVAKYEADITVADICNWVNIEEIKWISYRNKNGEIISNEPRAPIWNIDKYSISDREAFPIEKYIKHDFETIVQSTRWCYMKCKFCLRTKYGRALRVRKLENVIEEIKQVLWYWFKRVFFYDDTFTYSRNRTLKYCEMIKKEGLDFNWACNMRIDNIMGWTEQEADELLSKMKESWCYRVFVWLESSDDEVLKNVSKGITSAQIVKAIEKIKITE